VLRRSALGTANTSSAVLSFADLELDEESHEVSRGGRSGVVVRLRSSSCCVYLLLNAGRVLSKAQILDHVWQVRLSGRRQHRRVPIIFLSST